MPGTRKLSRLFIDEKVPRADRGRIPVLAGGRFKPLDSYAREVVTAVTGEESPKLVGADGAERRVDPLSVYLEWVFDPATARRRPLIAAPDAEARALAAPGRGEKSVRFSYDELAADADFFAVVAAALERPSETWSNAERELLLVRKRWAEFAENAGLPSDGRPTDPSLRIQSSWSQDLSPFRLLIGCRCRPRRANRMLAHQRRWRQPWRRLPRRTWRQRPQRGLTNKTMARLPRLRE